MITPTLALMLFATTLDVGPGKAFARIEDAVKSAVEGDNIVIYPSPDHYSNTAIRLQKRLTIRGAGPKPVAIDGSGFDYSGSGSVPRAIFQVEPSASGSKIVNLDLSGAHNGSYNGAGVRIQAANDVTISDCVIHDNDMGIMSNGKEGDSKAGSNQTIEYCLIERNGNVKDPGYNHNLYLGGTSVHVSHCEIRNSTTGHNVKSRAHYILIDYCWIHDAANREIDLPEGWDTERRNSNAVLIANQIVKDPNCSGNCGVLHFGQEKGTRNGSLYLFRNTFVTPFSSPVVLVSSSNSTIVAMTNVFLNTEQSRAELWTANGQNLAVLATNIRSSPAYGTIPGEFNQTGKSKSDTFDLVAPRYLSKFAGQIAGAVKPDRWIDGDGKQVEAIVDFNRMTHVGPRASPGKY